MWTIQSFDNLKTSANLPHTDYSKSEGSLETMMHRIKVANRFFEDYKKNENKAVRVDEIGDAKEARSIVQAAMVTPLTHHTLDVDSVPLGLLQRLVCAQKSKVVVLSFEDALLSSMSPFAASS